MSFVASDCAVGVSGLLMGRTIAPLILYEAMRKAVLELTEDYPHPLLEDTGPIVALTPYQGVYAPSFFLQTAEAPLDVSKVNSFYLFSDPYVVPSLTSNNTNAGYELTFKSFKNIEVLANTPGTPIYWTRNNNQIYLASMPDTAYNVYMRYRTQHPLSQTVISTTALATAFAAQQIMMADNWQEMLEYATAIRVAPQVNLADKRAELHSSLYGDQKFQTSGGIEGAPGLIFQRTSQRNRDQGTTTRQFRLKMGRV